VTSRCTSASSCGKIMVEYTHLLVQSCRALWSVSVHKLTGLLCSISDHSLILEPQIATKMAGDFRSGKRINIKKIIPYIASNFRR